MQNKWNATTLIYALLYIRMISRTLDFQSASDVRSGPRWWNTALVLSMTPRRLATFEQPALTSSPIQKCMPVHKNTNQYMNDFYFEDMRPEVSEQVITSDVKICAWLACLQRIDYRDRWCLLAWVMSWWACRSRQWGQPRGRPRIASADN